MSEMGITKTSTADFNQWLHAMRMVVRLPGEVPTEFRKKLWIALAERYMHIKRINLDMRAVLSDKWTSDDELELADQIVKDLHRTGSSFCSGTINQAKLKRVLVGYARWNKEVGYCQGFNMLGAIILQVVDSDEAAAIKIMIYLIEGVLPPGYFSGALTGLQADMGVFRDLLATRLPSLSKHLQMLQGQNNEEPPLINVFTMQWFLTLFCTCLPLTCVLRVWDLILTDGGDILLRTALSLWELLETRIVATRSADDFYCKMGLLSGDLLNGSLIEANELVQRVVAMGQIHGLHKMRDKHLHSIAQWKDKRKLRLFYSDDDGESDDDSKVAMATIWGIRLNRRGSTSSNSSSSAGGGGTTKTFAASDREKIALDINLLKQQYGKLRLRQKQAQIILTAACARQTNSAAVASCSSSSSSPSMTLNNLLAGRSAITSNKGRRPGPPLGAIPPARVGSTGKVKSTAKPPKLPPETLLWKDTETASRMRRNSLKWKDIATEGKEANVEGGAAEAVAAPSVPSAAKTRAKFSARSESSSYSEEDSDSSPSTSLCDDENVNVVKDSGSSIESSPFKRNRSPAEVPIAEKISDIKNCIESFNRKVPDEEVQEDKQKEVETVDEKLELNLQPSEVQEPNHDDDELITSTSQLSPVADFSHYLNVSSISPLKTPSSSPFDLTEMLSSTLSPSPENQETVTDDGILDELALVHDEGVTNSYFERINFVERPSNLDLTDDSRTFERNSTLSIPTYEIIDVDDMAEEEVTQLGRSTSLNVLQNSGAALRLKCEAEEEDEINRSAEKKKITMQQATERTLKGKSSSLEDTKRPVLRKSLPVSCSETIEVRRSEKALEIIQENSKILHRILNKNNGAVSKEDCQPPVIESNNLVTEVPSSSSSAPMSVQAQLQSSSTSSSKLQSIVVAEDATTVNEEEEKQEEQVTKTKKTKTTVTSISDTLSSIENTIKSINSLCQEREMFGKTTRSRLMESIEEIISSGNAIKVQIDSSDDINRKLNPPSRSPSMSPIKDDPPLLSNGSKGRESPPTLLTTEYRPWTRSSYDDYLFRDKSTPRGTNKALDKSPSSPVITRSYLETLKATSNDTKERVVKSAENSPSRSLGYTDSEYDLVPSADTKDLLNKYLTRDGGGGLIIKDCPLQGSSKGYFDYGIGIEPRKHKSLEFDAI